jgi:transposase
VLAPNQEAQGALFYEFLIEDHAPQDHLLRSIDQFVDLTGARQHLTPFDSKTGRASVDPELMIRMLLVILFQTIHPFPRTAPLSDASIACRAVHGRFSDSDLACGICSNRVLRVASNKGWSAVCG